VTFHNASTERSGFTLIEILVAIAVFGIFSAALLTTWSALQTSALNTTSYAQRQNDQMRITDYLKRDIRRASVVAIYNGATLVTIPGVFGTELRLTIPDYYADSREEDNAHGSRTPITPTLTGGNVTYGAALNVKYYVLNGAIIREEAGAVRTVADSAGAFILSFSREPSPSLEIRSRVHFEQRMRRSGNQKLSRDVDVLCGQRSQLHL
jgi:prepilin-type N-terminal cleavage/methylation domain-containing protein